MILSIFDHLRGCDDTDSIFTKLEQINITLFDRLIKKSDAESDDDTDKIYTREEAARIIIYIIFAYSEKSDFLVLGSDYGPEKKGIADRIKLPEHLYEDVVEMLSAKVRAVIVDYINMQSNRAFKFLCFKKDMYDMAIAQGVRLMGNENFSIKDMQEHNKYINQLLLDIQEYEDQLRSDYRYVYENKEEISSMEHPHKTKRDLGHLENSAYIS